MLRTIHIYSDESRHRGERFFLLGGLWVDEKNINEAQKAIDNLRSRNGFKNDAGVCVSFAGEFKWTKVSRRYLSVYKELIDLFFEFNERDILRFNMMLVNTFDEVIQSHNNLDGEGFYKLYYQLYLHRSLIPAEYRIFPDRIRNKDVRNVNFETVKKTLGRAFESKFRNKINPAEWSGARYVKEIRQVDSRDVNFIQIVDILIGALGYYQNRHFDNKDASKAKKELMKYVIDKLVYSGSIKFDGKNYIVTKSKQFNIWVFQPKRIIDIQTKYTTKG